MSNVTTLVVLGSKPNAPLPVVKTPFVFTANNAVELGALYRERYGSWVIGLVPTAELKRHEHIRQSFAKAQPDEVWLIGDDGTDLPGFVRNEVGLTNTQLTIIPFSIRNKLFFRTLGLRAWLTVVETLLGRGVRFFVAEVIPDLLRKRNMEWIGHSTGLSAVFYALERDSHARVVTAGIGLQGGQHFSGIGTFSSKTAKADQLTIKHWPPAKRPRLYTTDDMMHTLGHVPKWEGETFVHRP